MWLKRKKEVLGISLWKPKMLNFYNSETDDDGVCDGKYDDCESGDKFDLVIGLSLSSESS